MRHSIKYSFLLVVVLLLSSIQTASAQCAMCRATLEGNVSDGTFLLTSDNLNSGILYLLASPYALILAVALIWYYNARKNARNFNNRGYSQS